MEINKEIIDKIKKINWFTNCGNNLEISLLYEVSYIKNIENLVKHISSIRWENISLEEENKLTVYLFKNHNDKYQDTWNFLVREIKSKILPDIKEKVIKMAEENEVNRKEIITQIEWDILGIIMAYSYSDYMEPVFYKEIFRIYENGNIPCGWKGTYPKGEIIIY